MNTHQFRVFVVVPALIKLGLHSLAAEKLVLGTALHESGGLQFIDQVTASSPDKPGPAYGVCQMESATYWAIRSALLPKWPAPIRMAMTEIRAVWPDGPAQMMINLVYSVAMCRLLYYSIPSKLPEANDLPGLAAYYKKHYNSDHGAATPEQWIANFHRYGGDKEY